MPNWCSNWAKFEGPEELIKRLVEAIDENVFLATLRPEPKYTEENEWYDWRIANWGTKWEIDAPDVDVIDAGDGNFSFEMHFSSAWSPPTDAYEFAILNLDGLMIEAYYYESGDYFAGSFEGFDNVVFNNDSFNLSDVGDNFFKNDPEGKKLEKVFEILAEREETLIYELEDEASEGNVLIMEEEN